MCDICLKDGPVAIELTFYIETLAGQIKDRQPGDLIGRYISLLLKLKKMVVLLVEYLLPNLLILLKPR